ncbi:DUF6804 family protein [Agrobacterium tumefaciens]|jgi:hypothetical protein|uniref:DUF6804 family protein n=1 Tax=Agrobacterium tumefaciens TaxID=358 RepID=UPI0013AF1381|nr:hypothetical protein FY143_19235 [Agrobacterium tumefaciens]UXT83578.1 hypothetical protein FY131_19110 [Agrobacterium tumefaciens]
MITFPRHIILVPAVALVIAVLPLPYGYYGMLRLVIMAFAAFFAYIEYEQHKAFTGWVFGFICVVLLFNPFIPVHLSRSSWFILDLIAAGAFAAYWKFFDKIPQA